ncbi:MAG: N-acetylmuramoyl-L-alanine amidase [Bacteroidaceae bacterium]|nr:N-acetylmuramoyl-L-alanine amidase [Bacteroidaceae bacterium]
MRRITIIIIHCSGVSPGQSSPASVIDTWHRKRGWSGIGYHYVVLRDGTVETGRPESRVGAHCTNHNRYSIGICYEGGLDEDGRPADTRTEAQKESLRQLIDTLRRQYHDAIVLGHNDLDPHKACPCFDAAKEYV